ncbi:MAG: phosphate ABC transporter permease subunit PstC [Candidatus Altiarchaeota archaeon]|nr:phosphate ABC transporter permease subunit PstC [Candidatus Altiarchaeota archaeon]
MHRIDKENIVRAILLLFSVTAILILSLILIFLFNEGLPLFQKTGITDFLFGDRWIPAENLYGAFPFIVSALLVTLGAMLIAIPLGVSCAVFLAEIAPRWARDLMRPAIELLAGIPSIIYGLFALVVIVDLIRIPFNLANGETILAGSIILAVMVLPIIISISQDSIEAVPRAYREGSYAMGATDWQTINRVVVPAARRGVIAGIILGSGRAAGETMALALVIGNAEKLPMSLLEPGETLTTAILLEMGEAVIGSLHYNALFCLGIIPFTVVLIMSIISSRLIKKGVGRFG